MNKEEYIKAIEELNLELVRLYGLSYNKKYRDKVLIRKLIKTKRYKLAYQTKINGLKRKLNNLFKFSNPIKQNTYKEINGKKTGEKIVYTCILDDYDTLYSPLVETENTTYIVFSDNKNITQNVDLWQYRCIPNKVKKICNNNHTLINRYIKMHPHELFPEYDLALYIDGSVRVMSDIAGLFYKINDKTGLAMHMHPKREDVYEEAKACLKSNLGNKKAIKKLIGKYNEEHFPHNYGLFEATVIAIDLNNKSSKQILDYWWQYFIESNTYRDQLIFTYVLWKLNYKYEDMGILGINLAINAKFRRSAHNYSRIKKM